MEIPIGHQIIYDLETHDTAGIRYCFENGISPNDHFRRNPLIHELVGGYKRGAGFSQCVGLFVEFGMEFSDQALLAVLLNDAGKLEEAVQANPNIIHRLVDLPCAFTPLRQVTLMHVCAEFNHLDCARVLLAHGAKINAAAGFDEFGFGGQSPIFHTVNQHNLACWEMLEFLLEREADLSLTVNGLVWGKGNDWETFIPSVNPISYALMGLLPQFHRKDTQVYQVLRTLVKKAQGIDFIAPNVPNKYLQKG